MRYAIVIFLFFVSFTATASNDDLIAAGRAAIDRDPDEAIAQLEKAITANPKSADAHYYLGLAYGKKIEKVGMLGGMSLAPKAKSEFERAVELDPNLVEPRLRLIEFYSAAPAMLGGDEDK